MANKVALIKNPWTPEQMKLITRTVAKGATPDELALFFNVAKQTGLNVFTKQLHFVKRNVWNPETKQKEAVGTIQTGIDGYRAIAERTGQLAGSDDIVFDDETAEHPNKATVTIYRMVGGQRCAFTASAYWNEYAPQYKNKTTGLMEVSGQWQKMPYLMLGKCFSEDTEVLTNQGFKKFSEITTEKIMQVIDNRIEETESKPFYQDYDGDMVCYFSDDLNFCVTPNHDMVTTVGKIEAGKMFENAKARPSFFIPRIIASKTNERNFSEQALKLTALYMADGSSSTNKSFRVRVSRPHKITLIEALGGYRSSSVHMKAGKIAYSPTGREIETKNDQKEYVYDMDVLENICDGGKNISLETRKSMSQSDAEIILSTWMFFDGNVNSGGGKDRSLRLYTSNPVHLELIEYLAVKAGYSISTNIRQDLEWGKDRYTVTFSKRDNIPVYKRNYSNHYPTLEIKKNATNKVWCVTVPSGVIVVRREGFSMLCGNCAEALVLRKAFPNDLSGLYTHEEMEQADIGSTPVTEAPPSPDLKVTEAKELMAKDAPKVTEQKPEPNMIGGFEVPRQNMVPLKPESAAAKKMREASEAAKENLADIEVTDEDIAGI